MAKYVTRTAKSGESESYAIKDTEARELISAEATARESAIAAEATARESAIAAEASIRETKISDLKNTLSDDWIHMSSLNVVDNSSINNQGQIISSQGWKRTDYIDISDYKYGINCIKFKGIPHDEFMKYHGFYDANKIFIEAFQTEEEANEGKVIIPSNAKYMILTVLNRLVDELCYANPTESNGVTKEEYERSDKKYIQLNFKRGEYINNTDGSVVQHDEWKATGYIDIHDVNMLKAPLDPLNSNTEYNALYDANHVFIRSLNLGDIYLPVSDGYYVRFSVNIRNNPIIEKCDYEKWNEDVSDSLRLSTFGCTKDRYVNSNGSHPYGGWSQTGPIDVEPYKYGSYCLHFTDENEDAWEGSANCYFYSDNGEVLSNYTLNCSIGRSYVNIPDNAAYTILSMPTNRFVTTKIDTPAQVNGYSEEGYASRCRELGHNMHLRATFTLGGYISNETGELVSNDAWKYTDYIELNNIQELAFSIGNTDAINSSYNALYDENKEFIEGYNIKNHLSEHMTTAKYIRFSLPKAEPLFIEVLPLKKELPDYYGQYMRMKNDKVNRIIDSIDNCEAFVFFTDQHFDYQCFNSSPMIKNIIENTPVRDVICGGDVISAYGERNTIYRDARQYRYHYGQFKPYFVRGNHDCYVKKSDSDTTGVLFDNSMVINRFLRPFNSDMVIENGKTYYYFDRPQNNLRFISIDTTDIMQAVGSWSVDYNISQEQIDWFVDLLKDTPENYKIIVLNHIPLNSNLEWYNTMDVIFSEIIEAFNAKGSVNTNNGKGVSVNTSFDSTYGKVIMSICGHGHRDGSYNSPTGCVYYEVNCDSYLNNGGSSYTRTVGTISEQAFDVVVVNVDTDEINCIRYGAGEDKIFNN